MEMFICAFVLLYICKIFAFRHLKCELTSSSFVVLLFLFLSIVSELSLPLLNFQFLFGMESALVLVILSLKNILGIVQELKFSVILRFSIST